MSRIYAIGPGADAGSLPFLRGGTPTNDLRDFGAQYVKVGGSTLASFNNSLAVIGSSGVLTALTAQYWRFKIRLRRLPLQTTTVFAINSSIEGTPAVLIAVSTTGQVRAYNQGNQATYAQLIGNVGTATVGEWCEYSLFVRFRTVSTLGHLTMARYVDGVAVDTLDWIGGTSGFGLELIGAATRTAQIGGVGGASGGSDGIDFDICEVVSDDAADPGVSRISILRTASAGRFQEWTNAGMVDWRARWMFPYANFNTAATYAARTFTNGAKQSYVFQTFASQGITGTIKSAMLYWYTGSTGAPVTAPTLLIRRTTAGGVITDTSVTLYTVAAFSTVSANIADAANWLPTDTIEIGIQCNSASGAAMGSFFLTIEHTTPYVAPTDESFSCVVTQWTGNGTVQTVTTPDGLTPDFIWWMPASAAAPGGFWHRSMGSAQWFTNFGPTQPHLQVDGSNIYLLGNEVGSPNVSGRVYDVVIISDPTRRMVSPYSQIQSTNSGWDNLDVPIYDGAGDPFAPTFAMGVLESPGTSVSGYMRGPGQTGDSTGFLIGAAVPVTDVFQAFNADGLELGVRFPGVSGGAQFAFGAFRSNFLGSSFFTLTSYVGDGTTPRTVTLDMPGYSPSWVVVFTLTTSSGRQTQISTPTTVVSRDINTGTARTDGVTAVGSNSIVVGTGLNQNGATYVVFALAVGVDAPPTPPPPVPPYDGPPVAAPIAVASTLNATLLTSRRLRRFPHLAAEGFRIFYHRLQVDMETGVGLFGSLQVGTIPELMLRWSDDGGETWSNWHVATPGRTGEYATRVIFNRLGQGRDRVFELAVSDPVAWRLVDAYIELAKGNS